MRLAYVGAGALVVSSVLVGGGCSTTPPTPEKGVHSTTQAIQGGSTDNTDTFALGLCLGANNDTCAAVCSGALILPNVVATARHCVDETPEQIDCSVNPTFGSRRPGSIAVTTNTEMFSGSQSGSGWYTVASISVPGDDHICGNDLALLILNGPIPSNVARTITPGVQYQMWDSEHYDPAFLGIGYGFTSPTPDNSAGTRRISKPISVICVPGSDTKPCAKDFTELVATEFFGGDGTCQGDSGSSAYEYRSYTNNDPVSFGVLSRGGQSADGAYCLGSIYSRFDAHRDFVISTAKAASDNWTLYPEPSWTEYKPPPTPKTKDAGTDGATAQSSKAGIGETCARAKDCASGVCTDPGDGALICSQACNDATPCPDGYTCSADSVCLPAAPVPTTPTAKPTTTTVTSCAATPGSGSSTSGRCGALALGLALVVSVARRRKR